MSQPRVSFLAGTVTLVGVYAGSRSTLASALLDALRPAAWDVWGIETARVELDYIQVTVSGEGRPGWPVVECIFSTVIAAGFEVVYGRFG